MQIRDEQKEDTERIRAVNIAAFETAAEADLIDALRVRATPLISLVAEDKGEIVGHILFSPVTIDSDPAITLMGLAPMAVAPGRQRHGIGTRLVREGLERCRAMGVAAVVVVGHADYYPRFGFVPGSQLGLRCEYDVPDDVFMVRELRESALKAIQGTVRYHAAFGDL